MCGLWRWRNYRLTHSYCDLWVAAVLAGVLQDEAAEAVCWRRQTSSIENLVTSISDPA